MITKEIIKKANEKARIVFEATKRIYDLAFVAQETMSEDIAEQLGFKKELSWGRQDAKFINRYGKLSNAEVWNLRRYTYTTFSPRKTKERQIETVPFILLSIATRRFTWPPELIYGVLRDIDWGEVQQLEIEPFMYEISEKRQQGPLQVSRVNVLSQTGTAVTEFQTKSLFEITDDTIGDITREIIGWFSEKLK